MHAGPDLPANEPITLMRGAVITSLHIIIYPSKGFATESTAFNRCVRTTYVGWVYYTYLTVFSTMNTSVLVQSRNKAIHTKVLLQK